MSAIACAVLDSHGFCAAQAQRAQLAYTLQSLAMVVVKVLWHRLASLTKMCWGACCGFVVCSAIGDLYNFHLDPSLTLGCGSWGSTSVSANVGPQHLINVKTVAVRQENMLWFKAPHKIYFKRGSLDLALQEIKGW